MYGNSVTFHGYIVISIGNILFHGGMHCVGSNKHRFIYDGSDYIDTCTGEVVGEGFPIWIGKKSGLGRLYPKGWFSMAQEPIIQIAQDKELLGRPMQVFMYLCGRLGFENFIQLKQSEICEALDMRKQHVSRAIKLLLDKSIIERHPDVGNAYAFRLNPTYGYKGDPRGKVISLGDGRAAFRVIEGNKKSQKPEEQEPEE